MNLNHLNFCGKKFTDFPIVAKINEINCRRRFVSMWTFYGLVWVGVNFYGSMWVDVNFLWVNVGRCGWVWPFHGSVWVGVGECKLFMGGCELFMGWCGLVWVGVNVLWVGAGWCGSVWVGVQNDITAFWKRVNRFLPLTIFAKS